MSIQFGDILQHNNLFYPIVDINDVKGGLRSIATFSSPALVSEYASIPEKYRSGYSLLLETSTGTIYYLAGVDPTNVSHWSPVGIGGNGYGITNTIPKWTSSSVLGNSNITDNGDTVSINGNLMVIGTTSTISSENLLVKDPIILLAGSQSGTPTYDAGLFVNRGSSDTQAFIWDESETEFKFITTTSGATVSGDVTIGTYSSVRTGVLSVGTGTRNNSRFIVSSSGGTVSLVVDEVGNVYNRGRGNSTNTAFGESALLSINTGGYENTAIGVNALLSNTSGSFNTAVGFNTLYSNTGGSNTAFGESALYSNIIGDANTALGREALYFNIDGDNNVALGSNAGSLISGSSSGATNSSSSIFIGVGTRPQAGSQSNQIVIGHGATGYGSNTVTLGNNSIVTTYLKGKLQLPTTPTTSAGTYSILTRNDITGEVEKIVVTPYKVYTALLTQSGTASPTAIVLENTLGQTITWSYNSVGAYNSSDIIMANQNNLYIQFSHRISSKIASAHEHNTGGASRVNIIQVEEDLITPIDGLEKAYIEIRVYN